MKVLVTGGAGFIGRRLVDFLIEKGHDVIVIDNFSRQESLCYWNEKATYVVEDILNLNSIQYLFQNVDCVFHMAALTSVQESIGNPNETFQVNIMGTCNVLECCRRSLVPRVVFSSTSAVYKSVDVPISESAPTECLSPYATTKLCGEELMRMYHSLYGLETIILRYFNVFGPGQSSEGHYAPVMARFENQDKSGLPLTVTGDGTQTRDFVHLDDVVAANYMAAKCDKSLCDGSVYNIGSGRSHRIIDIARSISDNIEFTPSRSAEVRHSTANIDRAKAKLDWTPKREGFTI